MWNVQQNKLKYTNELCVIQALHDHTVKAKLFTLQYCGHSCSNALEQSSCGGHGQCKFKLKLNLRWCWLDWLTESHIYTSFMVHRGWKSGLKKQDQQLITVCR